MFQKEEKGGSTVLERPTANKPASEFTKKLEKQFDGGGGDGGNGRGTGGGGGGDGGEGPQEKRPDGENRRITEDERYSLKGSIAKDFIKGNLVNATQIEESGGMFEMLRHITTVRELIDDPESPYKLSYDLNTHTTSFYVTSSDHYDKKPWNLTNMETAIRYPGFKESDPI